MRAVFAHDHVFVRASDGSRYSEGKLPYRAFARYLGAFSSVSIVARERAAGPADSLELLDRSSGERIQFRPMPNLSSLSGLVRRRQALRLAEEYVADADVVIARVPSEIGSMAVRAARRLGKVVALEIVACPWDALWNHGSIAGRLYAPIAWRRLRAEARDCGFALYVTRSFLQARYPSLGLVAACSNVEIDAVAAHILDDRVKRAMSDSQPLRLGLIGSLATANKGIDTAVAALARLAPANPSLVLEVLGGGDATRLRALAEQLGVGERVRFLGTLPAGKPVHSWLRSVDVYLQPSRQEGLPRALIEAMAHGCPAIGSTAGGIPELLELDCLHAPSDDAALAVLIARAIRSSEWRSEQAGRNFREARQYTRGHLESVRSNFWQAVASAARDGRSVP